MKGTGEEWRDYKERRRVVEWESGRGEQGEGRVVRAKKGVGKSGRSTVRKIQGRTEEWNRVVELER